MAETVKTTNATAAGKTSTSDAKAKARADAAPRKEPVPLRAETKAVPVPRGVEVGDDRLLTVRNVGERPDGKANAFWEIDPRHPNDNGEVWITSGAEGQVYLTEAVSRAIQDGRLEQVK